MTHQIQPSQISLESIFNENCILGKISLLPLQKFTGQLMMFWLISLAQCYLGNDNPYIYPRYFVNSGISTPSCQPPETKTGMLLVNSVQHQIQVTSTQ